MKAPVNAIPQDHPDHVRTSLRDWPSGLDGAGEAGVRVLLRLLVAMVFTAFAALSLGGEPPNPAGTPPPPEITDANWVHFGSRLGPNGPVYASALDPQGRLCVGGSFTHIGDLPAAGLARWDGTNWSSLGGGLVLGDTWEEQLSISALAVAPNGTVFASGAFAVEAVSNEQPGIARWDGNKWSWLTDTNGKPRSASVTRQLAPDSRGDVYAVDGSAVTYWDDHGLRVVGTATVSTYSFIEALALDADGALFVGGAFTNVNKVRASSVAQWDGQTWQALGAGLEGAVQTLLSDRPGQVYAGGYLVLPGTSTPISVAHWNGLSWEPVGTQLPGLCRSLALGADGTLYAGVVDKDIHFVTSASVYAWDGTRWSLLPGTWRLNYDGWTARGRDILNLTAGPANRLFLGGNFDPLPLSEASGLTQWNGNRWSPLGQFTPWDLDGYVGALAASPTGSMYAGGGFQNVGTTAAGCVAEWTGQAWRTLGEGISGAKTDQFGNRLPPWVGALVVDPQGGLVVGGSFTRAGAVPAPNVARWDGKAWQALGDGLAGTVSALAIGPDAALWAGGSFGVARWDGNRWAAVGTGAADIGQVSSLAFSPSGDLIAGAYGVYRWTGRDWASLNLPLDASIHALVFDSFGNLYVSGREFGIDNYFHFVARRDGNQWVALAGTYGDNGHNYLPIYSLAADASGNVYFGGDFSYLLDNFGDGVLDIGMAGGEIFGNNLLRWNGTSLSSLGSGVPGHVYALAFDSNGNLFAGGDSSFGTYSTSAHPGLLAELLLAPTSTIDALESHPDGRVALRGRGTPGYSYVLETTSQLSAEAVWTPLVTNRLSQRTYTLTDRPAGDRQFYRNRFTR